MMLNTNQGTTIVDFKPVNFDWFQNGEPASALHYHLVLRSNGELSRLNPAERGKFFRFIANCAEVMQGSIETLGDKDETLHLLISLAPAQNPADFARRIKLLSASWAQRNLNLTNFSWSNEEVFTISRSQCEYLSRSIQQHCKTFFRRKIALAH